MNKLNEGVAKLTPTEEDFRQLHHNILGSITDLPDQSQIDFPYFADRDFCTDFMETDCFGDISRVQKPAWSERVSTYQKLLESTEDWHNVFDGEHVEVYNRLCLMYQFRPSIPELAFDPAEARINNRRNHPDLDLDAAELDEKLTETLLKSIPIPMNADSDGVSERLRQSGIERIGDLCVQTERFYLQFGLTRQDLRLIWDQIRELYGVNRTALTSNSTKRQAVRIKYFAMKSIQKFSGAGSTT